jgi:hypothetical protein
LAPDLLILLVLLGALSNSLHAALTTFLAARHPPLGPGELLFRLPVLARILNDVAVCSNQKDLEANVYASLVADEGQRFYRHLGARDTGVPAIRFFCGS